MTGFATKWVVHQRFPLSGGDLDPRQCVVDAAREYVELCAGLRDRPVRFRTPALPDLAPFADATELVVTARATEFLPDSVTIAVRLRLLGGSADSPIDTACSVTVEDETGEPVPLGNDIRDQLIALEHAARYGN